MDLNSYNERRWTDGGTNGQTAKQRDERTDRHAATGGRKRRFHGHNSLFNNVEQSQKRYMVSGSLYLSSFIKVELQLVK